MRPTIEVKLQSRISEEEKGPFQPPPPSKSCRDIHCLNNGRCTMFGFNTSLPSCICTAQFTGERCEKGKCWRYFGSWVDRFLVRFTIYHGLEGVESTLEVWILSFVVRVAFQIINVFLKSLGLSLRVHVCLPFEWYTASFHTFNAL